MSINYRQGRARAIDDIYQAGLQPCHIKMLSEYCRESQFWWCQCFTRANLWGLLIAHHCRSRRTWHDRELQMLNELATHIGIAINQGELYQKTGPSQQRTAAAIGRRPSD